MADYARIGKDGPVVLSTDFVNRYSEQLGAVDYAVRQLPEELRPHCTGCDQETHLFDIKNLVAGVRRPPKRSIIINPGFVHYKANPDCPYSYKGDIRIRDHIDDTEYDKQERDFNIEKLCSADTRSAIDAAIAFFLQPYAISPNVPDEFLDTVLRNEKRFIFSMAGIGNDGWLVPFELMLLMPDRKHQIKNGKNVGKEVKIGFRPSIAKQHIVLIDSHGGEHNLTRPKYIEFGFVQRGGDSVSPMMWKGEKCIFPVSRQGANDLWKKGRYSVPAGGFARQVEKPVADPAPELIASEPAAQPVVPVESSILSETAAQIAAYNEGRKPFTHPKPPRRKPAAANTAIVQSDLL